MKKKRKNITVAVTPEHYREIRHLAVEYDTTVTTLVAYLLKRLPDALRRANYPKPEPKNVAYPTNPRHPAKRTAFLACEPPSRRAEQPDSADSSPKPGNDTESVPQYTVRNPLTPKDFEANSKPCTDSVHPPPDL
jgi:hypothetical protein